MFDKFNKQHTYDFPNDKYSPYNNFIKINGIIYYSLDSELLISSLINRQPITQIAYIEPKTELVVFNKYNLDHILSWITSEKLSKEVKRHFMYDLKRKSPMFEIKDYPSSKCIFDVNASFIKYENDRFILKNIKDDDAYKDKPGTPIKDIITTYLFTTLNNCFIMGEYKISNTTKSILRKITGNNPNSLKALAMLTAAAYSNDLPLKKAIIIKTDDTSHNAVEHFFRILYDNNIYTLDCGALKNANMFFYAYANTLLTSGGVYLLKGDLDVNFDTIKNLVKSNYFEAKDKKSGKHRYKNKLPLIVLTENKDYAEKFACRVNSYTINVDKNFQSIDPSFAEDIIHLRQALALYGLKLLSKPQKKTLPKNNAMSIKAIAKEFADLYCKPKDNKYTSKTELRDAFNKYLAAYYPASKEPPIAICNHFADHGFKTTKKRSDKNTNPIWVINGIEFNVEKFNKDMAPHTINNNAEKAEDKFDQAFSELLSSKYEPLVKVFNV